MCPGTQAVVNAAVVDEEEDMSGILMTKMLEDLPAISRLPENAPDLWNILNGEKSQPSPPLTRHF